MRYKIVIKTLSDTMMGSGESIPGTIDSDIRYDKYGMPYMNAKTMKGHVREQMELLSSVFPKYKGINVDALLGSNDREAEKRPGKLYFSDVRLDAAVREILTKTVIKDEATADEILEALTQEYSFTAIDENGIAKDHSLRKERMVRKGLSFETYIDGEDLTKKEEDFLKDSIKAIQHIGTHKSKGKGLVHCEVIEKIPYEEKKV